MSPTAPWFVARQFLAACGAMLFLMPVWMLQLTLVAWLDPVGYANAPGMEPMAYNFWCCCSVVFILAVFVPISFGAEVFLVRRLHWRLWATTLAVGAIYLGFLVELFAVDLVLQGDELTRSFWFMPISYALWGVIHWLLFQGIGRLQVLWRRRVA